MIYVLVLFDAIFQDILSKSKEMESIETKTGSESIFVHV